LHRVHDAYKAISTLWAECIKPALVDGKRLTLEVRTQTRSTAENALLHAMLTYISKNIEWAGKKRDVDTWKRLLVAAWCRARGDSVEFLPALDGYGVDVVFRRTSTLTVGECAELIEFIHAWGAHNDVRFPADPRQVETPRRIEVSA
jgi:hypothetical protein